MKWQKATLFVALALVLSACVISQSPIPLVFEVPAATVEPSPTAFQPLPPTPTPEPSSRTYVILGEDLDRIGWGPRTDVIMLVTVNLVEKELTLVSIPRDLVVQINCMEPRTFDGVDWGYYDRANSAWNHGEEVWTNIGGGFACVRDMVAFNFGLQVSGVVMVDFEGFMNLIDLVGHIEVTASADYSDWCGDHRNYGGPGAWHVWHRGETYQMDGNRALCYARARVFSSDLDRNRRQQDIMAALREQVVPLMADGFVTDPVHFPPDVLRIVSENASTDMGATELLMGLLDVVNTKDWPIRTLRLTIGNEVTYGRLGPASVVFLINADGSSYAGASADTLNQANYLERMRRLIWCFELGC